MRDDELRRTLTHVNPWWRPDPLAQGNASWVGKQRALRELQAFDFGYRPNILSDIAHGPLTNSLIVLSGPRRVGKSTLLLDTIAQLCERPDIHPRQVIHVPCDSMNSQDLRRTLVLARDLTSSVDSKGQVPRIWFLDEITTIAGWSAILKFARDNTDFGDDCVIATGSQWVRNEDIEGNLLAGRAGFGTRRRRVLLPMTFRDFLASTQPQIPTPDPLHPQQLQDRSTGVALKECELFIDDYDLAWQNYLTVGGFPRAVAEHLDSGDVSPSFLSDLQSWLHRDVTAEAGLESIAQLLSKLSTHASSPLSVSSLAQELGYNKGTFDLRLQRMISSHALIQVPHRDGDMRIAGSQSKYYISDPLLNWLPSKLRTGLPSPDMTKMTEAAIGVALARAIDNLDDGRWFHGDTIGFTRTSDTKEIDFAPVSVPSPSGPTTTIPIESKWVDRGWKSESRSLVGKFGYGVVATKTVLDFTGHVWAIPAPILALLLN